MAVDLRRAQQGNIDAPGLQVIHEQICHAAGKRCAGYQGGVANGEWQACRPRTNDAALVHQLQLRRAGAARQIAGDVGQADAHEHSARGCQRTRRAHNHLLVRGAVRRCGGHSSRAG